MDVIIVCHTEFGYVKNNRIIFSKEGATGVTHGVSNIINIAEKFDAKITFAISPEVIDSFPSDINHELGLHIHPGWKEFNAEGENYFVGDSYLNKHFNGGSTSLRDYTFNEQYKIISFGREYFIDQFHQKPKTFVSGRWSCNSDTIRAIIKLGFTHDCSALPRLKAPHFNWSELDRISMPYHPSSFNYQYKGDLPITIIPVSQMLIGGAVSPEIIPYYGVSWLKACFLEYYKQDVPLFHICLHSPSMTDPFLCKNFEQLIQFISKHNVNFKFASDIKTTDNNKYKTNIMPYILNTNMKLIKTIIRSTLKI